jgi:ribosomal protein S18 acetylase RimI-like enzyme
MITLRSMTPEDIPASILLCRANRWNQLSGDLQIFLHLSPNDCRVAVKANKIVGSVTTIRYQQAFSWIGMLLVDPSCQRQGIGMQLLLEALYILKAEGTVKLDATPAGREVYRKMDFQDEFHLSRMQLTTNQKPQTTLARPMQQQDLERIAIFDQDIFGAGRQPLLNWFYTGSPELAFVVEEGTEITGYCLGRKGYSFTQIGPVIARDRSIARDLVSAALMHCTGQPVILDTPHHDPQWQAWLTSIGFSEQRPFIRMYRGNNTSHGIPEKQYAIAGPEFG